MRDLPMTRRSLPRSRARMAGMSIIELMIAIALGLIVMAGLATLFANQSAARTEMERNSRQIENGRFAMELLTDDLRMAGFYGELNVLAFNPTHPPVVAIDPCSVDPANWAAALLLHVQGWDMGIGAPACLPIDVKPNTDIVVIRRASTCEAGAPGCDAAVVNKPYIQVARCAADVAVKNNMHELGLNGTQPFTRTNRDCATRAALRQYIVRIYYISTNNGGGVDIPTLKRLEFNATTSAWDQVALVEGIEELQFEYGIDADGDGDPDAYTADPDTYACPTCNALNNWRDTVAVRIHLLARNTEPSVNYTDPKTYTLGRTSANALYTVTPGGPYRRHSYSGLVRIINPAERRDTPT